MKERPIIFTSESVRAILAGRKTQTRRVLRPLTNHEELNPNSGWHLRADGCAVAGGAVYVEETWEPRILIRKCPYGVTGDRLWVREGWGVFDAAGFDRAIAYKADPDDASARWVEVADHEEVEKEESGKEVADGKWRSPLFMPRWASRLTLEVTEVRVERLQEISEADAMKEGFEFHGDQPSPRDEFSAAWEEVNGKRAPWAANPWVWAITFQRLEIP